MTDQGESANVGAAELGYAGPVGAASPGTSPTPEDLIHEEGPTLLDSGDGGFVEGQGEAAEGADTVMPLPTLHLDKPPKSGTKRRRRRKKKGGGSDADALAALKQNLFGPGGSASLAASSVFGGDSSSVISQSTTMTRAGAGVDPGPVGQRIASALELGFEATLVKVVNTSFRHQLMKTMGSRALRVRKVTCSETSKLWTAQIVTMQMDTATGLMKPKLFNLGSTFKTEKKALKACDDAAARRDRGPPPPFTGPGSVLEGGGGGGGGLGSTFRSGVSASQGGGGGGGAGAGGGDVDDAASVASGSTARTRSTAGGGSTTGRQKGRAGKKGKKGKKKRRGGKDKKGTSKKYLETHYSVTVVSELFEHKNLRERLMMVYRVLHEYLWQPCPDAPTEFDSQWKHYSTVGHCVRNLPQWSGYPWNIFVRCLTPEQWAAHRAARVRQRTGSITSMATATSGSVPWGLSSSRTPLKPPNGLGVAYPGTFSEEGLKSDASLFVRRMDTDAGFVPAGEVKQLTESKVPGSLEPLHEAIAAAHHDLKLQRRVHRARMEAMAKAEEVWNNAGFETDELGRIVGLKHGGNSQDGDGVADAGVAAGADGTDGAAATKATPTPKKTKKKTNKQAARVQASALGGHVSVAAEQKAKADAAKKARAAKRAKAKAKKPKKNSLTATFKALYGDGGKKEKADVVYRRLRRKLTVAAKALQRIYRQHVVYPVLRELRRRDRAVTDISRVWRGYVARQFVREMHAILEHAATLGQCIYRGWVARRLVKERRRVYTEAAIKIQKLSRGWKGRRWWKFVFLNSRAAIVVQRVIRGFVARAEARHRRRIKHFHEVVVPSAIKIQAQYRRRLALRKVAARRAYVYHVKVEVPAATKIQSVWHMHVCILEKKRLRKERWAATQIQRIARGMGHPARYRAALKLHYDTLAADKIARLVRVWYSRRLRRHRAWHRYRERQMIPASIVLQRYYRGYAVRKVVRRMRLRIKSALVIQGSWRNSLAIRKARERWRELRKLFVYRTATKIQSIWRMYAAKLRVKYERHVQAAARIAPARQIQNWWRSRAARLAFLKVLRISRIRLMRDEMNEVRTDCETITADMEDIRVDVANRLKAAKKYKRQQKEIRVWRREMTRRLPEVEEEMEKLTEEDMVAGWGEAYEREFSYTTEALAMSAEELAGKKLQAAECELQIESLRVELDDLETDMDHELTRELEVTEKLRCMEIEMCEELWLARERREIARQRIRWAIRFVRKGVVRREYEERRAKAVDEEIEKRGGLAAMGIWDNDVDPDTKMQQVLAATKPLEQPKSVFGLTGFRKPGGRWSTPTKARLGGLLAGQDATSRPMNAPPPPVISDEQRQAEAEAEASTAWAQTKKALQFISRTVKQPAGSFAADGSRDDEVSRAAYHRKQKAREREWKRERQHQQQQQHASSSSSSSTLPAVGVPPHLAALTASIASGAPPSYTATTVTSSPGAAASPGGGSRRAPSPVSLRPALRATPPRRRSTTRGKHKHKSKGKSKKALALRDRDHGTNGHGQVARGGGAMVRFSPERHTHTDNLGGGELDHPFRPGTAGSSSSSFSSAAGAFGSGALRSAARARALARVVRLPKGTASLSSQARNAGGFGLAGTALGGVGMFPESQLGAEFAVAQPRGLLKSNTSVNIQTRLKRKAFIDDFRKRLDDAASRTESVRLRLAGAKPAPAVARTFDAVLQDAHALMQDLSFDMRRPKEDPRGNEQVKLDPT